jgi:hypothetical protein
MSPLTTTRLDLGGLGLDRGAHLLIARALAALPVGGRVVLHDAGPHLGVVVAAWCRANGHTFEAPDVVVRGRALDDRWSGAERAGSPSADGIVATASPSWGLAARGALVETGGPPADFALLRRDELWADLAARLYAQAAANQWDPETAIDWAAGEEHPLPADVEGAVVQMMTYLIENEQAALAVPARFLGRIHPHYREVVQLLAVQVADEARHIEVFSRRATLRGGQLGTSSAGGRASLQTLFEEPDFTLAAFLLSVLGEGTFLDLLTFIDRYAPDPVTAQVARLARADEARHVAFGIAHVEHAGRADPTLLGRLRSTVERRAGVLASTAGLNADVFDALVVLAAGAWAPEAIGAGHDRVLALVRDMDDGRRRRLVRLGFPADEAAELSRLHTRNFM